MQVIGENPAIRAYFASITGAKATGPAKAPETGLMVAGQGRPSAGLSAFIAACEHLSPDSIAGLVVYQPDIAPKALKLLVSDKDMTEEEVIAELCILIDDLQSWFKRPQEKKMAQVEVIGCARILYSQRGGILSLPAIAAIFTQAKAGKLGKVYDYIDGSTIMAWCEIWQSQLEQQLQVHRENHHHTIKVHAGARDISRKF